MPSSRGVAGPEDARRRLRRLARHREARRSWVSPKSSRTCRGSCGCARRLRRRILDMAARCVHRRRLQGIQPGPGAACSSAMALRTVQYVSPQVWAWRQGRVRTIGESVDLVLCLFPFEPDFYREHGVRAAFVGHPLADQIPLKSIALRRAPSSASRRRRACSRFCPAAGAAKWKSWPTYSPARPSCWPHAFPGLVMHRTHGDAGPARPVCRALRRARAHGTRTHARRPGAARAGGGRRGAGGLGHRDARDRAVQAAHGGGLPARARSRPSCCVRWDW